MTRERCKELLPVMQAFAEGEVIQTRQRGDNYWLVIDEPGWSVDFEYRIKPEPREFWLIVNISRIEVRHTDPHDPLAIHVREVID